MTFLMQPNQSNEAYNCAQEQRWCCAQKGFERIDPAVLSHLALPTHAIRSIHWDKSITAPSAHRKYIRLSSGKNRDELIPRQTRMTRLSRKHSRSAILSTNKPSIHPSWFSRADVTKGDYGFMHIMLRYWPTKLQWLERAYALQRYSSH